MIIMASSTPHVMPMIFSSSDVSAVITVASVLGVTENERYKLSLQRSFINCSVGLCFFQFGT